MTTLLLTISTIIRRCCCFYRLVAIFIALCCWFCLFPSARLKTSATARPLPVAEPVLEPTRQRREIGLENNPEMGLESLHLSDNQALKLVCDPPSPEALLCILGPAFNARYMAIEEPPEDNNSSSGGGGKSTTQMSRGDDVEDAVGIETDASYRAGQGRIIDQRNLKPLDFVVDPDHEEFQPEHGLFSVEVKQMLDNATHLQRKRRDNNNNQELWKQLRRNNYERFTPKRINNGPHGSAALGSSTTGASFTTSTGSLPTPPWHCPSKVVWQNLGPAYFPQFIRTIQCGRPGSQGPTSCWFGAYECAASSFTMKILHRRSDFCYPVVEANRTVRFEQKWTFVERAVPFCCSCQFKLFGKKPQTLAATPPRKSSPP